MAAPIIRLRGLTKEYSTTTGTHGLRGIMQRARKQHRRQVTAVDHMSFSIEEGELVGFLGPNGAGKTTTLKMLSGILHPTSGDVEVLGYTPWQRNKQYQRQFALVMGQKNQLLWDLPALDSFTLQRAIYGINRNTYASTIQELAELLEVTHVLTTPVRLLSLGERMKCELIAALLHHPRVLFLDEPTIGLDVVSQQNIRSFIRDHNHKQQTTIILTSHYMDDVEALCNRVIIIAHGKKMYDGSLANLIQQYTSSKLLTMTFRTAVERGVLERFGTIRSATPLGCTLEVQRDKHLRIASEVLQHLPVEDLTIDEIPIEEIVRSLYHVWQKGES